MKIHSTVVFLGFVLLSQIAQAAELVPIPADEAVRIGAQLTEQAAKLLKPAISVNVDADKANGVHVEKKMGLLIVPQKDLKEGEELAAKFKTETGAPLAFLFLHHVVPIVESKRVDEKKLHRVSISDNQGQSHEVQVLLLSVRQLAGDDYRLYAYGQDSKPLIDAKFSQGAGTAISPAAVEVKNPNASTKEATVVVTVFGKYEASFPAAYTGD